MFKQSSCCLITLQLLIIFTPPILTKPPVHVCKTASCRESADHIIESMDLSVDPCDNFYQFACGKFINTTDVADDKQINNYYIKLGDKVQRDLRKSLEALSLPNEPKFLKLAKILYKSCMNASNTHEKKSRDLLFEHIKKAGGWPVLEGAEWNETNFNWIESTYYLSDMGFDIDWLFKFEIDLNPDDNAEHVIVLSQTYKIIHPVNDLNRLIDVAESFGVDPSHAFSELLEIIFFCINFIKISIDYQTSKSDTFTFVKKLSEQSDNETIIEAMTIEKLSYEFPSINWKEYISRTLMSTVEIQDDDLVFGDISTLSDRLDLIETTPTRTIANFIMSQIILKSAGFLKGGIRNQPKKLNSTIVNKKDSELSTRWKGCVDHVSESLKLGVGALYVRDHFEKRNKQATIKIVTDIQEQFIKNLEGMEWMDKVTKENAIEKVKSMTNLIAYPEEFLNDTKLDEYYVDLELSHNNYLQAVLNLSMFNRKMSYKKLREPFNKTDWVSYLDTMNVNAFNVQPENTIIIPAAILQGLFISNDRPRYMDYSAIGFTIGHEVLHGFDVIGSQRDNDGNLGYWWNSTTAEKFSKKLQCLIDQYNNYTADGVHLNGRKTLDDNIADNGGFKVAYSAYKNWSMKNREEPKLPGLSYNPLQMFWINAAAMHCTKYGPRRLINILKYDYHALYEFRIVGSFSNIPEFSQDFNCPPDSKMNGQDKCILW